MNREQPLLPHLRDPRSPRSPPPPPAHSVESEDSQRKRSKPNCLEPWIVKLLLEYKEPKVKEDGQFGHVLKVLNDAKTLHHDEECSAVVLQVADGKHYIPVVVSSRALQMTKWCLPEAGYSSIVGQFIILQNYRVCFKQATKVEDCGFYLKLNSFQETPIKRQEMKQQDCNQEPSVLQKIKELWQRSFALQPWHNPATPSVSEVLQEISEDKLHILKQNVKDCLNLLDSASQLNSEELAVYPETKWQVERKQDKVDQDIFTIPAKFLVISAENEEIHRKTYPQKPCNVFSDTSSSTQDDDHSTVSYVNAESVSLNGSLENPWDIFPALTLTSSSDKSGTLPGLPHTEQVLLAKTAEEETPCTSSCTPDFLSCAHTPHCNSEQSEQAEPVSPSLFLSHKKASPKEPDSKDSTPSELNAAHNPNKVPHADESITCGQQLGNSHSHVTMSPLSPVNPPMVNDLSFELLPENTLEDKRHCLQKNKVVMTGTREGALDISRKSLPLKRKQMIPDGDKHETLSILTHTSPKAVEQPSTSPFPKFARLDKVPVWKSLKYVSTPKKYQTEETEVQHCPTVESIHVQNPCRYEERLQRNERKQRAAEGTSGSPELRSGVQEQECVRRPPFHVTYEPPTSEVCSQVCSTRVSRALLGWARWVFSNMQGQ